MAIRKYFCAKTKREKIFFKSIYFNMLLNTLKKACRAASLSGIIAVTLVWFSAGTQSKAGCTGTKKNLQLYMQSAVFSGNVYINSKVMFYVVKPQYQPGINANQSHFTWTRLHFPLSFLPRFSLGPLFIAALFVLPCCTSLCTYFHSS